jgi:hypothetical protein
MALGAPNFLRVIDAYEQGSERARRSRLEELAERGRILSGQVLAGDTAKLPELLQTNPEAGMKVQQFTREQKAARLDEIASGAFAADTPEKWNAFVQRSEATGHALSPEERDFGNRQAIIDQAMGWKEKLAQSNADRSFNAEQDYKNRSLGLQERNLAGDEKYRAASLDIERQKLLAKDVPSGYRQNPDGSYSAVPGGPADPNRPGGGSSADFKDITAIRKEIGDLPSYKTLSSALPVYNSMVKAADTKAGDLNMVYGLAKLFDPGSVVREGEQVLVRDTASLPDWLVGQINSLNGGNRLLADTRKALLNEARSRVDAYQKAYDANLQPYRGIADRHKINQADVIPQMGVIEEATTPANNLKQKYGLE